MRPIEELRRISRLEQYNDGGGWWSMRSPLDDRELRVIASWGDDWDHVSVSRRVRTPTWREMEHVRMLFFRPDEVAMQLHVPAADHINIHPYCLHMWRPHKLAIPMPPGWMV